LIRLNDEMNAQNMLNVFKLDADYLAFEEKYKQLRKEILGSDVSDSEKDDKDGEEESSSNESDAEQTERKKGVIFDNTETNLIALRETIYLTIGSSLVFEECAHKLMKLQLKPGLEIELCHMVVDCCAETRTYEKFFGLLTGRLCTINKIYVTPFEQIFKDAYHTIH
ncbi:PREDICTED: pre-mRNA-splicing factor CWC22 homolog, partial [Wasmannia auropunctata]|uniref:pre-mRNA-splicing factor CWC22 homolog n=1 Tax=Wasmannia auropunctata TaxID=64793 RepID=UPI0005EF0F5C